MAARLTRLAALCCWWLLFDRAVSLSGLLPTRGRNVRRTAIRSILAMSSGDVDNTLTQATTRRQLAGRSIAIVFGLATVSSIPMAAGAQGTQEAEDKAKLLKGFQRLTYLLDNWEEETTICGQNDNPYTGKKGCDRTPLKVMDYMGYKSMNDPLFKAEKTMRRLEPLVPGNRESEFLDAVEKWVEAADEASGMAYVSSWVSLRPVSEKCRALRQRFDRSVPHDFLVSIRFITTFVFFLQGEANPGGGKDRVEYFIERAKKNVVDARDSLATAIDILKI